MSKFIRESQSGYERIDKDAGIIYGVKVLGPQSRNGRVYEAEAIANALPLYEGVSVNLNHQRIEPKAQVQQDRRIEDRWGVLKNARLKDGSIYADLHYLKTHPATPQLIEAAERFPETFGLSHDAAGDEQVIDGKRRVVELLDVRSVDIVADPATNNGLFESQERVMKKKFKAIVESCEAEMRPPMEGMMKAYPELQEMDVEYGDDEGDNGIGQAFKMAMMKVLDDSTLDTAGKLAKIKAIMMAKEQADAAMGSGMTEEEMAKKKAMEESEKRNVANLCESLTKQVESLKSELENNKCKTLLVESNIEPTALRIKALLPLNQADRIELAKTWKPGNVATGKRPERTGSVMHESASGAYPADFKEFSRMLG
jgi:hypothetical protein